MIIKQFSLRILFHSLLVILSLMLTACASKMGPQTEQAPQDAKSTAKRITATKHLSHWKLTGALAARSKHKSWTASLDWEQHTLNRYRLRLYGPLGSGTVLVEKNGRIITYQDGQHRVKTTDIDKLLYKETGIRVPIHNLYYWVRGIKAPGAAKTMAYDDAGRLITLNQGGYTIRFDNYQTVKGKELPGKIKATGPGGELKLVIKHWEIH